MTYLFQFQWILNLGSENQGNYDRAPQAAQTPVGPRDFFSGFFWRGLNPLKPLHPSASTLSLYAHQPSPLMLLHTALLRRIIVNLNHTEKYIGKHEVHHRRRNQRRENQPHQQPTVVWNIIFKSWTPWWVWEISNTLNSEIVSKSDHQEEEETHILSVEWSQRYFVSIPNEERLIWNTRTITEPMDFL